MRYSRWMPFHRITLTALALMLGCGARSDLLAPDRRDGDLDAGPDSGPIDPLCDRPLEDAPPCEGTGQIWVSTNECIDDGGSAAQDDLLEVYCVNNIARFCLSHEACPWRNGAVTSDEVTCSTSGLSGNYMANTIGGCHGWEGNDIYCC